MGADGLKIDLQRRSLCRERERLSFAVGASRTFKIPGGESKVELYNRVAAGVEDIAAKFAGKTIIVVAHGGALRAIYARLQGVPVSASGSQLDPRHC